ncbi:MAG: hypothetical protein DWQ04_12295 [Chloroflexi bacterium]|nr:MAG: hypothetical protein DWQ04_12295 [Chloroflexota bacterium]
MEQKQAILDKLKRVRETLMAAVLELGDEVWETAVYTNESNTIWTIAQICHMIADYEQSHLSEIQKTLDL